MRQHAFDPDAQLQIIHGILQHRLMVLLIQEHGADQARRRDGQAETAGRAHTQARGSRAAYDRVAFQYSQ
jgi:hypothetical protein